MLFQNPSASNRPSRLVRWAWDVLSSRRKINPFMVSPEPDTRMMRDILRLAETSPHLLQDIGFEEVAHGHTLHTVRWRAQQRPDLELTETHSASVWDLSGGR